MDPTNDSQDASNETGPRIPLALQEIFLESNMGKTVDKPPPAQLASRVFKRPVYNLVRDSPLCFMEDALKERGYDVRHFRALESAYHREPTPLQLASYDVHVLKSIVLHVHYRDSTHLREMLSCGLSPSACNKYGETMVHRVAKANNLNLLRVFLDCGASVQVASDYGRTPLHEVCSATKPSFEVFEAILMRDPRLIFMSDVRGATPLSYVRKEFYDPWIRFLSGLLDTYWPRRDVRNQGPEMPPPLALEKPDTIPIPDPPNALPVLLASMVAAGSMTPSDAIMKSVIDPQYAEDEDEEDDEGTVSVVNSSCEGDALTVDTYSSETPTALTADSFMSRMEASVEAKVEKWVAKNAKTKSKSKRWGDVARGLVFSSEKAHGTNQYSPRSVVH